MEPKELAKKIKSKNPPCVVDVRSSFEFKSGHIPGAVHASFWSVLLHLKDLPPDKKTRIVVTCEHGPRAQLAAAQFGLAGYRNVELLTGHMAGWRRAGLPVEKQ